MSVVIKGMDKPKTCFNCPCKMYDEVDSIYCAAIDVEPYIDDEDNGVLPDCPISALPQKHGRLIDADRLIAVLKNTTAISQSDYDLFNHIVGLIEHQPTVIGKENAQ